MLDCWHENPDLRSTFERLYEITTELLEVEVWLRTIMKLLSKLLFKYTISQLN